MLITAIAQCRISELAANRDATEAACLCAGERALLAAAPLRRLAGVLAAKRAVLQLSHRPADPAADDGGACAVRIGHRADGAPCLEAVPLPLRPALDQHRIQISISHTGDHAYGLAVLEEEA